MSHDWINLFYLAAAIAFIVALKMLTSPRTARMGNALASGGMLLAVVGTLLAGGFIDPVWILIGLIVGAALGAVMAMSVPMTAMPQMVSFFNGSGGLAAALVAVCEVLRHGGGLPGTSAFEAGLSCLIGSITFTGSMIAFGKLQELLSGRPVVFKFQKPLNLALVIVAVCFVAMMGFFPHHSWLLLPVLLIASAVGVLIVIPIGGADMPVVIAMLNSLTGLAAATTGFLLGNVGLIISGALVGASGGILTLLMCRAMNRSLANVLLGSMGLVEAGPAGREKKTVRNYSVEDARIVLESAGKVIIIPGYGLAVARAQHAVKELASVLEKKGVEVRYAVHPVAGRMPGHMNVLLAEADIPYNQLLDLDQGNAELESADAALIVGANDVVNPVAHTDPKSPIWGMPVLDAEKARTVIVIKRSLSPGFAGIDNPLFYRDNTMMLFGDAREMLTELVTSMKG